MCHEVRQVATRRRCRCQFHLRGILVISSDSSASQLWSTRNSSLAVSSCGRSHGPELLICIYSTALCTFDLRNGEAFWMWCRFVWPEFQVRNWRFSVHCCTLYHRHSSGLGQVEDAPSEIRGFLLGAASAAGASLRRTKKHHKTQHLNKRLQTTSNFQAANFKTCAICQRTIIHGPYYMSWDVLRCLEIKGLETTVWGSSPCATPALAFGHLCHSSMPETQMTEVLVTITSYIASHSATCQILLPCAKNIWMTNFDWGRSCEFCNLTFCICNGLLSCIALRKLVREWEQWKNWDAGYSTPVALASMSTSLLPIFQEQHFCKNQLQYINWSKYI